MTDQLPTDAAFQGTESQGINHSQHQQASCASTMRHPGVTETPVSFAVEKQQDGLALEEARSGLHKSTFLPPKPEVCLYDSKDPTIEQALPALVRQHAAKLAGVGSLASTANNMSFPALPAVSLSHPASAAVPTTSSFTVPIKLGLTTPSSTSSLSATTQLATLGVGVGPGINPNIANPSSNANSQGVTTGQNNPPIINTGNNGPMYVQPGDWVCSTCGFVNWRRRRVCMRCYPFADSNEMSNSIANGALLAAQLAAGYNPPPEIMASLAQPRRNNTMSISQNAPYGYDTQNALSSRDYTQRLPTQQHGTTGQTTTVFGANAPHTRQQRMYDIDDATADEILARLAVSDLAVSSTSQYPEALSAIQQSTRASSLHSIARNNSSFTPREYNGNNDGKGIGPVDSTSIDGQHWMNEQKAQLTYSSSASLASSHSCRDPMKASGVGTSEEPSADLHTGMTSFATAYRATDWATADSSNLVAEHARAKPFVPLLSFSSATLSSATMSARESGRNASLTHSRSHGSLLKNTQLFTSPISSRSSSPPLVAHLLSTPSTDFAITVPSTAAEGAHGDFKYVSAADEQDEIVQPTSTSFRRHGHLVAPAPPQNDRQGSSSRSDGNEEAIAASDKSRQAAIEPPGSRKGSSSSTSLSSWNSSSKSSLTNLLE